MEETVELARSIARVWKEVALRTSRFKTYEIDIISRSRVDEDETAKALTMLKRYVERGGTRLKLAEVLNKLGFVSLSPKILLGYFIDTGEEQ